jgi:ABC-2 type transport system permease protein
MATDSKVAQLERVSESGWRSGLSNLMNAGFGSWWGTRTWWAQSLVWTAIINGTLATVVWRKVPGDVTAVATLYGIMTMMAAIAVTIRMQEVIVGEKRSGTAAWVLSKPVSRTAFILSKLVPNAVGIVVTMIAIPSGVLFAQLALAGIEVSPALFALGAAVAALNLLFYLTLTLMLGTLFDVGGPVIAIPLVFAFGQQLVVGIPGLASFLPWSLLVPSSESKASVIAAIMGGRPVPTPGAIVFTAIACVVFSAVAFWKFARTEL